MKNLILKNRNFIKNNFFLKKRRIFKITNLSGINNISSKIPTSEKLKDKYEEGRLLENLLNTTEIPRVQIKDLLTNDLNKARHSRVGLPENQNESWENKNPYNEISDSFTEKEKVELNKQNKNIEKKINTKEYKEGKIVYSEGGIYFKEILESDGLKIEFSEDGNVRNLIADRSFPKGTELFKFYGIEYDKNINKTWSSVQTGENKHLECPHITCMNHSSSPNAYLDYKTGTVRTDRAIKAGDSINFNYNVTEAKLTSPFEDFVTGEHIGGFTTLTQEEAWNKILFSKVSPQMVKHFSEKYRKFLDEKLKTSEGPMIQSILNEYKEENISKIDLTLNDERKAITNEQKLPKKSKNINYEINNEGDFEGYAKKSFKIGNEITKLKGNFHKERNKISIELEEGLHFDPEDAAWISHSAIANVGIDISSWTLKAIKPIQKGDKLTLNYNSLDTKFKSAINGDNGYDSLNSDLKINMIKSIFEFGISTTPMILKSFLDEFKNSKDEDVKMLLPLVEKKLLQLKQAIKKIQNSFSI